MAIPNALQAIIDGQLRQRVPSLAMAVIKGDHVQWAEGFGLADLRTRRPAAARTIYLWFSMTKIVTATAVMQLVDRGRLDLDGAAADYLPEHARLLRPVGQPPVTIRHLLGHSAGPANPLPIRWVHPIDAPGS